MNFFIKLTNATIGKIKAVAEYEKEHSELTDDTYYQTIAYQKKLLLLTVECTNQFKWIKEEEAKEKVRVYLKNNCSLRALYSHYQTHQPSVTEGSLRASIAYAAKTLQTYLGAKDHLGRDIVDKIVHDVEVLPLLETHLLSIIGDQHTFDLFYENVFAIDFPPEKPTPYVISDCLEELQYLRLWNKRFMEQQFREGSLNKERLHYLVTLLTSEKIDELAKRHVLLKFLQGVTNTDQLVEELQVLELYKGLE